MPVAFPVDDEFEAATAASGPPEAPKGAFVKGVDALRPFKRGVDPLDPRYPACDPNDSSRPNPVDPNPPKEELKWNPNERFYPKEDEVDTGATDPVREDYNFKSSTNYSGYYSRG